MKLHELTEAIVKTDQAPIIRAQSTQHILNNIEKAWQNNVRGLIFPNQIWFIEAYHMTHQSMALFIVDQTPLTWEKDVMKSIGVFLRYDDAGSVRIDQADFHYKLWGEMQEYPVIKRFDFKIGQPNNYWTTEQELKNLTTTSR